MDQTKTTVTFCIDVITESASGSEVTGLTRQFVNPGYVPSVGEFVEVEFRDGESYDCYSLTIERRISRLSVGGELDVEIDCGERLYGADEEEAAAFIRRLVSAGWSVGD